MINVIRTALNNGKALPELSARESFVLMLALAERAGVDSGERESEETAEEAHALLERLAAELGCDCSTNLRKITAPCGDDCRHADHFRTIARFSRDNWTGGNWAGE